ncbi:unnamed protein product [Victoria cruziana]
MPSPELATPFRHSHSFSRSQAKKMAAVQRESEGGETAEFETQGIHQTANGGSKMSVTERGTARSSAGKFSAWARWLLGSLVAVIFPYWQMKWQSFRRIEGEIETVAENVESALEMAEKVAAAAEKVSEEVAASLPSDGKLKDAALFVEHVSEEARREAELTLKLIREVAQAKKDMETIMEPIEHQEKE